MAISLKKLKDQVIVITGASSGIGLVTARMAAAKGAKVVVAARNEEAIIQLAAELRGKGYPATWVTADVGKEEDVQRIADTAIRTFGRFDTWINNAGVSIFGKTTDVSVDDMKRLFDTVYWGVVYGSRVAVQHFTERGVPGALINIGSLLGDHSSDLQPTYSSAKHAVHGWTDNLRIELEKSKAPVSVTLIHPGKIDTPHNDHAQNYLEKQPAQRGVVYPPEAVARAILYAAEHPKRDMFVGSQAKVGSVLGGTLPQLADNVFDALSFRGQSKPQPAAPSDQSGLHQPGYGLHERGSSPSAVRKGSLYVEASRHPVLTTLALAGLATIAFAVAKNKCDSCSTTEVRLPLETIDHDAPQ
ncbi:SDR family oxidoreductase [Paenibacillus sp. WLX2291]|uniref:SDR family oxidoreductase n=1 Tax=Paenibacillus sp. WLX2291 TaxID=3296934 RepID=UPI0039843AB8